MKIVVFSGAGISAESGIKTFRDADGLWENHPIEDVATPGGFRRNPELVLRFYNQRRQQLATVHPNAGHLACVELEQLADVVIITQNVDNLHERAGSKRIIHLHGELDKAISSSKSGPIIELNGQDINLGDLAPDGKQLRPYIVWFGEEVPMMEAAIDEVYDADHLIVVGTSLQVYPAASLIEFVPPHCKVWVVDRQAPDSGLVRKATHILEPASTGLPKVVQMIRETLLA